MNDQELRDKLASKARPLGKLLSPYEQDLWCDGWDAARANDGEKDLLRYKSNELEKLLERAVTAGEKLLERYDRLEHYMLLIHEHLGNQGIGPMECLARIRAELDESAVAKLRENK